jgi:ribosomal subunit interface protein
MKRNIDMSMYIQARGFSLTNALEQAVMTSLDAITERHQEISNIEVRLEDVNGTRHGGNDKRCSIMVYMPKLPAIVIRSIDADMYQAIRQCASRLKHQLDRTNARLKEVPTRSKIQEALM